MSLKIKITVFIVIALLSGCTFVPGMQNPDINRMHKINSPQEVHRVPTVIPITPRLLAHHQYAQYTYHVAPSDVLTIDVWQHPELLPLGGKQSAPSGVLQRSAGEQGYLVEPNGSIYFPLIGKTQVAGKSVGRIRRMMTKRLKNYIKNPEINVRVADFRGQKIYVLGEVKKPGVMPLNDQALSITGAIALAGGLDSNAADPSHIYVIRGHAHQPTIYWLNAKTPDAMLLAEHFNLAEGDIVFVSSASAARWNRAISQLLPTVQTIWYTNAIIHSDY